eukprot:TRINITY_DN44179_c0_g1_i1.p1 TRINITY_DN44179_c0_g1~~TRINITY_DN44179_c0_g1_i1.p1  ORF type:complete len:342 (+),score=46.29 TRINITY_DN44179_c0_g1_i1:167-1192(+)
MTSRSFRRPHKEHGPVHVILVGALRTGPMVLVQISDRPRMVRAAGDGATALDVLRRQLEMGELSAGVVMVEAMLNREEYTAGLTVLVGALLAQDTAETESLLCRLLVGIGSSTVCSAVTAGRRPGHLDRCLSPPLITQMQITLMHRAVANRELDLAVQIAEICFDDEMRERAMGELHLYCLGSWNAADGLEDQPVGPNTPINFLAKHCKARASQEYRDGIASTSLDAYDLDKLGLEHVDTRGMTLEARAEFDAAAQVYGEQGNTSSLLRVQQYMDLVEMPLTQGTWGVKTRKLHPLTQEDLKAAHREELVKAGGGNPRLSYASTAGNTRISGYQGLTQQTE